MAERKYNEYIPLDRPKLPRNKYGFVNGGDGSSSSMAAYGDSSASDLGAAIISLDMLDLDAFRGATDSEAGTKGVVPAPGAGMNNWFYLRGSGDWDYIPAAKWLHEFPQSEGLEKTGLEIDGNFNVTDTITTMNLEVQGSAHFWELVIDKVKAQGGQVLVSPSMFHVDYVGETVQYDIFDIGGTGEDSEPSPLIQMLDARTDIYNILTANGIRYVRCRRLYQRSDDGERAIKNECYIGDMMRCRSFNLQADTYRNVSNTDYWSFVVNAGEESYIDDDNNEYDAIYIDLAFTLRNEQGHNFPLGTILNIDGTYTYPKGYTEILDALELKKKSMEMWNGTDEVEPEFFENAEWKDIQEKVIDIRGIDDQIADLTGRANSDGIGRSGKKLSSVESAAQTAAHGLGENSSAGAFTNDIRGTSNLDYNTEPQTTEEERQAEDLTGAILGKEGENKPSKAGLTIDKKIKSELTLQKGINTDRTFIAGADLYDENNQLVYEKGATIEPLTGTNKTQGNWKVIDYIDEDIALKTPNGTSTSTVITGEEKTVIDTFPEDTPKNVNRDPENFMEEQDKYSERTSWQFGYSGYYPDFRITEGDDLACLGHLYNADRQNAIVLSSTNPIDPDLDAPAIAQYSHLDTFGTSISKYRQTAIAANGNEFMGQFFINYNNTFVDVNDRINMMIMDVKTGLEAVGIHLDGENSTIKMVGSVELKQHDQTNGDTLSVFDSLGRKKVEIIPTTIPSRDNPENPIEKTRKNFNTITDKKNAGEEYISYSKDKKKQGFLSYSWEYVYILDKFNLKFTTSIDLGHMDVGNVLTLNGLNLHLLCNTYLCGSVLITNHGALPEQQDVSSLKYTLKVNGGYITDLDPNSPTYGQIIYKDVPITGYSIGGRNTGDINVTKQTLLSIGSIPYNGSYTLDITAEYYVHARAYVGTRYPDYYYSIECGINGYVNSNITRTQGNNNTDSVSRMTIGTNGMYFLGDKNYRYFYAGEDGYEMHWGNEIPGQTQGTTEVEETSLMMDSLNGFRMLPLVKNVTGTVTIEPKYTMVICAPDVNGYTITLPDATEAGVGRELTIIGFNGFGHVPAHGLKVKPAAGDTLEFISGVPVDGLEFALTEDHSVPSISLKVISTGSAWYITSYV